MYSNIRASSSHAVGKDHTVHMWFIHGDFICTTAWDKGQPRPVPPPYSSLSNFIAFWG